MGYSMDPLLLGFHQDKIDEFSGKSKGHKLVPWMSWDEWDFVRVSLFSNSSDSVASALSRIAAWRSRGCLPIVIEATASIIEIQRKDPSFRLKLSNNVPDSEEILAMLYSMAVMRLVNGLVEKSRRRTKVSIAEAAAAICMPRMLIDIRHEASHRDLPSLPLLRQASTEALNWLKSYYWDSQKKAIPFKHGKSANIKEEIRSRLQELSSTLETKQRIGSSSSEVKGKRCGKQIIRTLKTLVHSYAFFSSEFVSVLLEYLLGMTDSLDMVEFPNKFRLSLSLDAPQAVFDPWKHVITKLSEKEPEILLSLLTRVADMIDAQMSLKNDIGRENFSLSLYDAGSHQIQVLSSLFYWLLEILKGLMPTQSDKPDTAISSSLLPKSIFLELLRRCLLISVPGNDQLFNSALTLSHMLGDNQISERLKKLSLVFSSSFLDFPDDNNSSSVILERPVAFQDKDIQRASEKLQILKFKRAKGGNSDSSQPKSGEMAAKSKWSIAESWNPSPLGMLPCSLGSSGCLPVLQCAHKQKGSSDSTDKDPEREILTSMGRENWEIRHCGGKRGPGSDLEELNTSCAKKMRENGDTCSQADVYDDNGLGGADDDDDAPLDELKGHLMINGVLQKVREEELKKIQSGIRILVTNTCRVSFGENVSIR